MKINKAVVDGEKLIVGSGLEVPFELVPEVHAAIHRNWKVVYYWLRDKGMLPIEDDRNYTWPGNVFIPMYPPEGTVTKPLPGDAHEKVRANMKLRKKLKMSIDEIAAIKEQ